MSVFVILVPVYGIISKFLWLWNPHCLTAQSEPSDFNVLRVSRQENIFPASTCLKTSELSHPLSQINTSNALVIEYKSRMGREKRTRPDSWRPRLTAKTRYHQFFNLLSQELLLSLSAGAKQARLILYFLSNSLLKENFWKPGTGRDNPNNKRWDKKVLWHGYSNLKASHTP